MKIAFHGANAGNFRKDFEALVDRGHEIVDLSDNLDQPGEREHFASAEVIVGIKLTAADPTPANLKLYHAPAAGTDAIDVARLPAGAKLCNAFGHEVAIAEYVMTALLSRHVPLADADKRLRQGEWKYWAGRSDAMRTELGSQTVGLLGYGHIGKAIAARAKAFGMGVVVANRSAVAATPMVDRSFALDQLDTFMGEADAIVVSLPLMDATKGIVGAKELAAMRPNAIILNVGRGPVIDERALFDVLKTNRIGGAIIDTWYSYPTSAGAIAMPSALPFHELGNLVMTPHMSGWTHGTIRRRQQTIADNIRRLAKGEPLVNVIA